MVVVTRFSHWAHSWRLTHHRNTSYALLLWLILAVGVLLAGITWSVQAADPIDVNESGEANSYTVTAAVPAPRPTRPAIITSPGNGQTFSTNPITVEGTCQATTLVKIYKNGILAGAVVCGANGRFSLQIDLVIGRNDLTARSYNVTDQEGPESPVVTVTLNQPPGGPGFSTELIIQSEP